MSDFVEQAREMEANATAYDKRLKNLIASSGPLIEQGPVFADRDYKVCVPMLDVDRLAKARIIHIDRTLAPAVLRLTS